MIDCFMAASEADAISVCIAGLDGLVDVHHAVHGAPTWRGPSAHADAVLPEWLRERRADLITDDQIVRWQRVVDLLVVAGDTRVADLAD